MAINSAEVDDRKQLFAEIAQFLFDNGTLPEADLVLYEKKVALAVDAYFLLNDAYKRWRIKNGHRTQNSKIAALSCVAIITVRPFRLLTDRAVSIPQAKANEIYALTCASVILNARLRYGNDPTSNLMHRIMDIVTASRSETLEPLLVDLTMGIEKRMDEYVLHIHPSDELAINALISIFELVPTESPRASIR